ncbi:MAG: DNA repair ATPase [Proteobacteria bacterium]|nr:DNA repair ATPase [Pseudomonadota bacterium]
MADDKSAGAGAHTADGSDIDEARAATDVASGNYEVIRRRLVASGQSLQQKTETLNARRKEVFGGTELQVVANERVRTENNCVPRDIVAIGDHLLFGYNVFIGLKSETSVSDVFALHRFEPSPSGQQGERGGGAGAYDCSALNMVEAAPWLCGAQFEKDFHNVYRYYREAKLLQLVKTDTRLLAVFQIGATHAERKIFRWHVRGDNTISYTDDRGEEDYAFSPAYDFEWTELDREHQVSGRCPHLNVEDTLFVESIGGDLTVKIENNTDSGEGIYSEPVDDHNQSLDDAKFHYARLGGLIVLKILPFRETRWRYLVFSDRSQKVVRIDAIGQACLQLPEDHGIIFPGGYFLQSGEYKVFDSDIDDLEFKRVAKSPNGEDVLYVFHRRRDGHYALHPYNLIRKEVQTPIHCHGYSIFSDGRLVVFRSVSEEPTRVHPMQVWQTPFTSAEYAASAPTDGSFLANVGNADLVRGISDAFSITRLIGQDSPVRQTYEDIVASCSRVLDSYYWLGHAEVDDLARDLAEIRSTAELIIDEFEKVQAFRRRAVEALADTEARIAELERDLHSERWHEVATFLEALTRLRGVRGHIITLREMRYIDLARLDELEQAVVENFDRVSRDCVRFLLRDDAFVPLKVQLDDTLAKLDEVEKVADIKPLMEAVGKTGEGLDLLGDVVSNLQIDDATQRTTILESIAEVFAHVNRVRATVDGKQRELMTREGRAEFGAQFKLLGQSVSSALAVSDGPERCDEELARIMVQLEELEGRFSEFDEFLADLAAKREEIYEAFGGKKQALLDERQRRVQNIIKAATRIVEGISRRARSLATTDDINGYFASDAMVMKLRQLAEQLADLGDTVKADELEAQLKSARQNALRALRDRLDLFEDSGNLIKLGKHRFSVNTQPLDLTMVERDGDMMFHLGGTDFYEPVDDPEFAETRAFWSQDLVSETAEVYRAEYLAASILFDAEEGKNGLSIQALLDDTRSQSGLVEQVRAYAQERYDEGYERGVHDADAALILDKLLAMRETAGLLRFSATPRALGVLFWAAATGDPDRSAACEHWQRRAQNFGRLRNAFSDSDAARALAGELGNEIAEFARSSAIDAVIPVGSSDAAIAGSYLLEELMAPQPHFVLSHQTQKLAESLIQDMELHNVRSSFQDDMRALEEHIAARLDLAKAWIDAFIDSRPDRAASNHVAVEAAVFLCTEESGLARQVSSALTQVEVTGLLGRHSRIQERSMDLRIDEFETRLRDFARRRVPGYRAYRKMRGELLVRARQDLRLDELMPRVMTAFVRNKLINDVYLHLIGDNLAKQMGAAGGDKRTDLMGMLLLISPPGYGKTTLMEYVANRLGLVFVKVNGPSLGHSVHSLDPAEAPNATARQEVEKINLAFEMGNNVMLYCDDIQHTHPEFLQKFISLCDAQRRIEGVWKGRTRTYDMRGKKFCVVMAGNPYTESGESFQIPDMLSNRADVYNLGDVLSGQEELFALSYIENALTSNSTLAPLATREQSDVYKLIRMAKGEELPTTELSHGYSAVELNDIKSVLGHLFQCQRVLLAVNQQYIESAAQDDRYRTEPPFKLQGSYRNMNKLAEKVVSAMTGEEVDKLMDDHYLGEAQTLTTEAEQNLLKLAEGRGRLSEEQSGRWAEIKAEYRRIKRTGGADDDPVSRVTATLSGLAEGLEQIEQALKRVTQQDQVVEALDGIQHALGVHMQAVSQSAEQRSVTDKLDALATGLSGIQDVLTMAASSATSTLTSGTAARASGDGSSQLLSMLGNELSGIRDILAHVVASAGSDPKLLGMLGSELSGIRDAVMHAVTLLERNQRPIQT